ncbi:MAG TPA: PEP/pyruvate-binding domain-containing protein, partial [Myxococcota bacterium]|nr:PEP/pyruvate-binding domain-containing protein [Myxococcota bacterium]
MSSPWILPLSAVGAADLPRVGGKGANLGWMARAGMPIPDGFCITTEAFTFFLEALPDAEDLYARLEGLAPGAVEPARLVATEMRACLERLPVPPAIQADILAAWRQLGADRRYAVRSSATAEDLPGASFAGQQDTFLNVAGEAALIDAVKRCWISLFTDRAVLYRLRNGFPHRAVSLSVVVQKMVQPESAGILFTADPVGGSRNIVSIDAGWGLGEALVSGLVTADLYRAEKETGKLLSVKVGDKAIAILVRHAKLEGNRGAHLWAQAGDLALHKDGDAEAAASHLDHALALDGEHLGALRTQAALHEKKGNWASAVDDLLRAEAVAPQRAERIELL